MRQSGITLSVFVILTTAFLSLSSCTHSSDAEPGPTKSLAQTDQDALNTISFESTLEASSKVRKSAAQFFGGLKGSDFRNYLDTRIKYFLTAEEVKTMTFPDVPTGVFSSTDQTMDTSKALVIAANIGGPFWEIALANGYPNAHVQFRGLTLAIDNPRSGLMLIGPGYVQSVKLDSGEVINIPTAYRQATLLHEARHSDCTGGVSKTDLLKIKESLQNTNDLENMACLHRHIFCPAGHEYQFLPACDSKIWGAYSASALFSAMSSQVLNGQEKRIMQMKTADQISRLLVDTDKMFNGELGAPDLSSSGVIQ